MKEKEKFFNSEDLCAKCKYTDKERAESHLCQTCNVYKGKKQFDKKFLQNSVDV